MRIHICSPQIERISSKEILEGTHAGLCGPSTLLLPRMCADSRPTRTKPQIISSVSGDGVNVKLQGASQAAMKALRLRILQDYLPATPHR